MQFVRPALIAALVKGKVIDAVLGFVDTFNWMLSCALNFSVGPGLSLKNVEIGTPALALNLKAGDGISFEEDEEGAVVVKAESGASLTVGECENVKKIVFVSTEDSNVTFDVAAGDEEGTVTVTVGVYYRN